MDPYNSGEQNDTDRLIRVHTSLSTIFGQIMLSDTDPAPGEKLSGSNGCLVVCVPGKARETR